MCVWKTVLECDIDLFRSDRDFDVLRFVHYLVITAQLVENNVSTSRLSQSM